MKKRHKSTLMFHLSLLICILFLFLLLSTSAFALTSEQFSLKAKMLVGIVPGMTAQQIIIALSLWFLILFIAYGILQPMIGRFFAVIVGFGVAIFISFMQILSGFFGTIIKFVATLGAFGIAIFIAAVFVLFIAFHFGFTKWHVFMMRFRKKPVRWRTFSIVFILFILFFLPLAYSQQTSNGDIEKIGEGIEKTTETMEKLGEIPYGVTHISFFQKVKETASTICSPIKDITQYIFGYKCSAGLPFVIALVLWIAFFLYMSDALSMFTAFSEWISYIIGFALAVIIANIGIITWLADFLANIFKSGLKGIVIGFAIFVFLIIIYALINNFKKISHAQREKAKREAAEAKVEAFSKGMGKLK